MELGPILLVEDSRDDEALILRSLKKSNVSNQIVVARDGVEALRYLGIGDDQEKAEISPAIVLLDIKLPRVDGLEVLDRIRSNQRTKQLPVVMLTSSDEEADLLKSYQLGVNSYVRKPVNFDDFSKAVTQLGLYWLLLNEPPPGGPQDRA